MKVAFWSSGISPGEVTEKLAAIGAVCALHYNMHLILSSSYLSNHMIEDCFLDRTNYRPEKWHPFCACYGEPEYYRTLWERQRQGIHAAPVADNRIILAEPQDSYAPFGFSKESPELWQLMDLGVQRSFSAKQALEEADAAVIFLSSCMENEEEFFKNYASIIPKALFVVEKRSKKQSCTAERLTESYGISRERISYLSPNKEYSYACDMGEVIRFFDENLFCTSDHKNYEFIHQVKTAIRKLRRMRKGGSD